jgi:site-specific recombinase XerD
MKTTDFAECLHSFFTVYLSGTRNMSENTIKSYRDTFKWILTFSQEQRHIPAERLTLSVFNSDFVENFLTWLKKDRNNSISTINQRLAAIHAFIQYVKLNKPEHLLQNQKILAIRSKKRPQPELTCLLPDTVQSIIQRTDRTCKFGRRDAVLLSLLYDSAARVQELADLCVRNVRVAKPCTVTLTGKGNKTRSVPISTNTAELLKSYMNENRMFASEKQDYPLFFNHQHHKLTRAGIAHILKKYCDAARKENPMVPETVSPHVFRHSRAMHMLQAGINLIYIRDFLGHVHVTTTEIYARADTETKRAALEKVNIPIKVDLPDWTEDKSLMTMLKELCQ